MFDDFLVGGYFGFISCACISGEHLNFQGTKCTVMVVHKSLLFIYLFEVYFRLISSG